MSFLKNFIASIGNFFTGLFNETEKVWDELDTDLKSATQMASGIMAIVNANSTVASTVIWQLISEAYPNVTQAQVTAAFVKINNTINTANTLAADTTFEEALTTLQTYLNSLPTGNTWVSIIQTAVAIAVDVFAPGNVIQKVVAVLEYVYQKLIKPNIPVATA
jgi:hypothetical protein